MATMLDHQVGWAVESTWNTPVTVTRFGEWLPGSGLDYDPNVVQGKGLRVGSQVARAGRRVALVGRGSGKLAFELSSKGFGTLLQAALGTATSTLVSGTTYQQVFTPVVSGTYLPSLTIQEGIVKPGGTVDTYTHAGCSVTDFEIEVPDGGIATLSVSVDSRSMATATALATASYPTTPTLYNSGSPITAQATFGGTLTVPTTTALASVGAGTGATGIKSWTLSVANGLDTKRDTIGGRNQPVVGMRELKLKTTVEYDSATGALLRDSCIGQVGTPIVLNLTTPETLSAGTAQCQLAIPVPEDGKVVTTEVEWSILDNLTQTPLYLVLRTADATL